MSRVKHSKHFHLSTSTSHHKIHQTVCSKAIVFLMWFIILCCHMMATTINGLMNIYKAVRLLVLSCIISWSNFYTTLCIIDHNINHGIIMVDKHAGFNHKIIMKFNNYTSNLSMTKDQTTTSYHLCSLHEQVANNKGFIKPTLKKKKELLLHISHVPCSTMLVACFGTTRHKNALRTLDTYSY